MALNKEKSLILTFFTAGFLLYSFYLYATLPAKSNLHSAKADHGKMLWQQYNCIACHQVYGLGGYLGPDLTNTYSKKGPEYIKAFLSTGTAIMPDFRLTESEITALQEYLKNIDASGNADPKSFTINKDGTIEQ